MAYYDQRNIQRVLIGRPWNTPDIFRDGLYVRDVNGKDILAANGLGVQIADENQIRGGSTVNIHYFPNTCQFGYWAAPNTHNIANRTLWNCRLSTINMGFLRLRLWINNSWEAFSWDPREPFPSNVVIDTPSNTGISVMLQGLTRFLDGSTSWQNYNVQIANTYVWSVHEHAKTIWTIMEMKR